MISASDIVVPAPSFNLMGASVHVGFVLYETAGWGIS
jgi:hypothetical protein